jgi:DNA-directed RNA polymerase subunit F
MTKPKILNEEPMSIAEVKESLVKIKERDKALTFRGNKTEEYVNQFAFLSSKKAAELSEKLQKLKIPRLKEQHIKKLVDVLPTRAKDVKTILQGYTITVKAEDMKKIAEAVKEFAPKK